MTDRMKLTLSGTTLVAVAAGIVVMTVYSAWIDFMKWLESL